MAVITALIGLVIGGLALAGGYGVRGAVLSGVGTALVFGAFLAPDSLLGSAHTGRVLIGALGGSMATIAVERARARNPPVTGSQTAALEGND